LPIGSLPQDQPAGEAAVSPFRVVGISMAAIGAIMLAVTPFVHRSTDIGLNGGMGLALLVVGGLMAWKSRKGKGRL